MPGELLKISLFKKYRISIGNVIVANYFYNIKYIEQYTYFDMP